MADYELEWSSMFEVMSWIYSIAWSLSFYGQILENYRLKNVEGMNFSFAAINLNGFTLYALYNLYGFFIDQTQTGLVGKPDLFFALHALAATSFTIIQACIYPSGKNRFNMKTVIFISLQWALIAVLSITRSPLVLFGNRLGLISLLGYMKLVCSCLKYIPQLAWNYKRKTTKGWSIFNVLMDLTGGIFSVSEICLRTVFVQTYSLNITKLLLGVLTIAYDLLFVYQHYCLYRYSSPTIKIPTTACVDSPTEIIFHQSIEKALPQ